MQAAEFVLKLAQSTPRIEDLRKKGVHEEVATMLIASHECRERAIPLSDEKEQNEIMALLNGWDVSGVEIGFMRFIGKPVERCRGIQFGVDEADPLIILPTGEIILEEEFTDGHILSYVAESPGRFLDAICAAAEFLSIRGIKISYDDSASSRIAAEKCASLAGGTKYSNYYSMLVGPIE